MLTPNLKGGLSMAGAMAAFTFNDSIVKALSATLPMTQIIFIRGFLTTVMILALFIFLKQRMSFEAIRYPLVWLRALMEVGATFSFLFALKHIPIGNAVAILSALPLAVTLAGALFLKAPVGWRRLLAILIGFCGVMLIIRPGYEGFNAFSLLVVATVCFAAARDLVTHRTPTHIPSLVLVLMTSVVITLAAGFFVVASAPVAPIDLALFGGLLAAAVFLIAAYYCVVTAMRHGDIAFVAPFRYTNLLWALLIGFLFFGDPVDWLTLTGSAIIVSTGIYTLYREGQSKRQ